MQMRIDWFAHYKNKLPNLDFSRSDLVRFEEQSAQLINEILRHKPAKVIEVGCGLARDSFVLADRGVKVTILDHNKSILHQAELNSGLLGIKLDIVEGDFFQLSSLVRPNDFDLAFHSGVLEHFSDKEISQILREQLKVVPIIIFTVPIEAENNKNYFSDNLYRRLLNIDDWKEILASFNVKTMRQVESRHTDLLVVVER